jgi:hypothetical protein
MVLQSVNDSIQNFPGPLILFSRVKWWKGVLIGGVLIILSILARYLPENGIGLTLAIFGMAFAGVAGIVSGVILFLRPGASLHLDQTGFEIISPFSNRFFRWSEASDFGVYSHDRSSFVAFNATKPRLTNSDKINAALTGGKNGLLPDTYGMAADDLAHLMTMWRNMALNTTNQTGSLKDISVS